MTRISISYFIKTALVCLAVCSFFSCKDKDVPVRKSSANKILAFSFSLTPKVDASIDTVLNVISATLPLGTDITKLAPVIKVSAVATVSPASGVVQDFSKPVTYTVKADDGSTRVYTVKITSLKSSEKKLLSFKFSELTPEVIGIMSDGAPITVVATVPKGTSLKNLKPSITISAGATINPGSGIAQDFTNVVNYTITAEDGTKSDVVVKVQEDNPTSNIAMMLMGKVWIYSEITGDQLTALGQPIASKKNVTVLKDGKSLYGFTTDIANESFEFKADGIAEVWDSFYEDYVPETWELSSDNKTLTFWTGSDKNGGTKWTITSITDTKLVVKEEYWGRFTDDSKLTSDGFVTMNATITLVPNK